MKKFLIQSIAFFFVCIALLFLGVLLPNKSHPKTVDYALIKKHELINATKSPKVILTGGSNVLFGFNSAILQEELQKPVINHAIHAGYGLQYVLDDILQLNISKGDTVILAPEYSHFIDKNRFGKEPLLFSLTAIPKNLKLLRFQQIINVLPYLPKFALSRMKSYAYTLKNSSTSKDTASKTQKNYTEYSINTHGDHDTHWNLSKTDFSNYTFYGTVDPGAIEMIENFEQQLQTRGAKLIVTYPSLMASSYQLNIEVINNIYNAIHNAKFDTLGTPLDYVFEDHLFYDTPYHLNGKGVDKRSHLILNQLHSK